MKKYCILLLLFFATFINSMAYETKDLNESHNLNLTGKIANATEKVLEYIEDSDAYEWATEKWRGMTRLMGSMFHKQQSVNKDFKNKLSNFGLKVKKFFTKHYPQENITELMDSFSDKFSEFLTKHNITDYNNELLDKFHDFTNNITQYFKHGDMKPTPDKKENFMDKMESFMHKIAGYFHGNHTDFKGYVEKYHKNITGTENNETKPRKTTGTTETGKTKKGDRVDLKEDM
jgi:hypothetical protein